MSNRLTLFLACGILLLAFAGAVLVAKGHVAARDTTYVSHSIASGPLPHTPLPATAETDLNKLVRTFPAATSGPEIDLALNFPEVMQRVKRQIDILSAESLSESLANLYQVNMFTSPGSGIPEAGRAVLTEDVLPLDDAVGESDLHSILSNRRFSKVFQELSALGKSEAAALLAASMTDAVGQYDLLFAEMSKAFLPRYRSQPVRVDEHGGITSPTWTSTTVDEKERVLLGARYHVLSLAWIAGALGLEECHEAVKAVTTRALNHRAQSQDTNVHFVYRDTVLRRLSLYNRQILTFALVRTSPTASKLEHTLSDQGTARTQLPIAPFDAPLTPYDLHARSSEASETLEATIECYTRVSDDAFDAAVNACGLLSSSSGMPKSLGG